MYHISVSEKTCHYLLNAPDGLVDFEVVVCWQQSYRFVKRNVFQNVDWDAVAHNTLSLLSSHFCRVITKLSL